MRAFLSTIESVARSLREGMTEIFTVQRLQLPSPLYKCLRTTNIIESPESGWHGRAPGSFGLVTY